MDYDAYDYGYDIDVYASSSSSSISALDGVVLWMLILAVTLSLIVSVVTLVGLWKTFTKAGKPGWAAIVPIYNLITMLEIAGRPVWWIILTFIPFANIYVHIQLALDIAKSYGKTSGFGVLLIFFPVIGYLILGFGRDQYVGPAALAGGYYYGAGAQPQYAQPGQPYAPQQPQYAAPQAPQTPQAPQAPAPQATPQASQAPQAPQVPQAPESTPAKSSSSKKTPKAKK